MAPRFRTAARALALLVVGTPLYGAPAFVQARLDADYPSLESLYCDLHAHPELSLQEEKTGARLAAELRIAGFDVTEKFGGTGVVGVLKNGQAPRSSSARIWTRSRSEILAQS